MYNKDAMITLMLVIATFIIALLIVYMVLGIIAIGRQQRKKHQQYLQSIIQEREATMHSLSAEIHDNICQMLHAYKMNTNQIHKLLPPELQPDYEQSNQIIDRVLADARNISHALHPFYMSKKGLIPALEQTLKWINNSRAINCCLNIHGDRFKLETNTELIILRIAQEAITNIIKHAAARNIVLSLSFHPVQITLMILDDGKGFDPKNPYFKEGTGMINMKQRAEIIKGKLDISSEKTGGSKVILLLPLKGHKIYPYPEEKIKADD